MSETTRIAPVPPARTVAFVARTVRGVPFASFDAMIRSVYRFAFYQLGGSQSRLTRSQGQRLRAAARLVWETMGAARDGQPGRCF